MAFRAPTIIQMPRSTRNQGVVNSQSGINCGCCRCCTCIHLQFLKTLPGALKILELLMSSFCQSVLVEYGIDHASTMGHSFYSFLTSASSCMMVVAILLGCYIFSAKSYNLIRQSNFEIVFNAIAAFLYWSTSFYLAVTVKTMLFPMALVKHQVYPAMSLTYGMGTILGCLHAYDSYQALLYFRSFR